MKTEDPSISFDFHPLANLFPLMNDEDLAVLGLSIQDNGQREPVILYEGKILDGRNRFRALKALNLPILTSDYEGDDPVGYVADHNLHRRHLKASQRAAVAALLSEFPRGRRRIASPNLDDDTDSDISYENNPLTQDEAAHKFGVSKRLVAAGSKVRKQGHPDLINLVKDGKLSIESAVLVSDMPMESQEEVLLGDPENFRKAIKDVRSKHTEKKKPGTTRVANQAAPSQNALNSLIVPTGEMDAPRPLDRNSTIPLSELYSTLMSVGELVLSSGFDAEEWFIRHVEQLPGAFEGKHMRAVMSALGVVEQMIDLIQERETDRAEKGNLA